MLYIVFKDASCGNVCVSLFLLFSTALSALGNRICTSFTDPVYRHSLRGKSVDTRSFLSDQAYDRRRETETVF